MGISVPVKAVFFDLLNTLTYYDGLQQRPSAEITTLLKNAGFKITLNDVINSYCEAVQTRMWNGSKEKAYHRFCEYLNERYKQDGVDARKCEGEIIKIRDNAEARLEVYKFAVPMLDKLRSKGILTGVISNISEFALEEVKEAGLLGHVDIVVASCDVGVLKPDKTIYNLALNEACERLKKIVEPEEVIMIGDDKERDVDGPCGCGWNTIEFKCPSQVARDLLSKYSINLFPLI